MKSDSELVEDWYEKSYPLEEGEIDVMKRERIEKTIDGLAEELRENNPKLSHDQAIVKVIEAHPELYTLYAY